MRRKMKSAAACAIAMALAGSAAAGVDDIAYPHFDWIQAGSARPTPRTAQVIVPCFDTPTEACLHAAWIARLRQYREEELQAPALGWRSYRVIWDRSFLAPVSIRLDIDASGAGRLTTHWLDRQPPLVSGDSLTRRPDIFSSRQPPVARVSREEAAAFEAALKAYGFESIEADPEPEVVCSDGSSFIVEAVIGGRYRYVSRACSIGEHAVTRMGFALVQLAEHKRPDRRFKPYD